ncbi:MAG: class 1 fructose-bisphosphatase [Nitrososphaerales archaeon]
MDESLTLEEYSKKYGELSKILLAIAEGAKKVSNELSFRVGMTQSLNPFGEKQAELDVFANETFCKELLSCRVVGQVASEELDSPRQANSPNLLEMLSVAMDPLDGSSNITTNNPLGSIFGVWRGAIPKAGREQVGSAFVTYGPTLSLTFCFERKVDQFVLVREGKNSGEFVLAYEKMKLPMKPEVYGFGGSRQEWIPQVVKFVEDLELRGMRLRYGGTFIGDYNQVLQRGGIFSYPALKNKPNGKLRIMYETAPVSLITQSAGGYSSNGRISILDIEPSGLTETSAFYTGNRELVLELEKEING